MIFSLTETRGWRWLRENVERGVLDVGIGEREREEDLNTPAW